MTQLKLRLQKKKKCSFRKNLMLLLFLVVSIGAFAQSELTGKVTDQNGEPVIGASIKVKGTNSGTITDVSGAFKLNGSGIGNIVISYIGYQTQEIAVNGKSNILVQLKEDQQTLDEVVVVGYGNQKKVTMTGAVSQISGDAALKGRATTNLASALQGQIPGLTITRTSSRPGNEGASLQLRGGVSVNSSANNPMILIDGIDSYQWELSSLNPNDVESISVLKDAETSIYGTRGAAGVILITTKRGKEGKVKVTYNGSSHVNYEGNRFPVASGQQYGQMNVLANSNDAIASGSDNNWWMFTKEVFTSLANNQPTKKADGLLFFDPTANQFDAVYGTTWGQSHNVSISGGSNNLKARTSFGYADDRSLLKVALDGVKKYNFRTNLDFAVNKWIKFEGTVAYDKLITTTPNQGIGAGIQDPFIFPLYNPAGQFYDAFGSNNLLAKLTEGGQNNITENIFRLGGKATVDMGFIKPLKGLSFSASAKIKERTHWEVQRATTVTMYDWNGELKKPNNIFYQTPANSTSASDTYMNEFYGTYEMFGNYVRALGKNHFDLLSGVTAESDQYTDMSAKRINMASDLLDALNTGDAANNPTNSGNAYKWGLISYLGRLNYDFDETYLLKMTYRSDGSSKLDPRYRWKSFGGASAAVRFSQFDFIKNLNVFDNLKLRASYGESGSVGGLSTYDYISLITQGTTVFGTTPAQVATSWVTAMTSPYRTWERVATKNVGLDFTMLNNRLTGQFDYYNIENTGMLISVFYPSVLGATAPPSNDGFFTSKGFEAMLQWKDKIGKDFQYNIGATLADARTEVSKYPGATLIKTGLNSTINGKPVNSIYVYRTDGYLQNETEVTDYYSKISGPGTLVPVNGTTNRLIPGSVRKIDLNNDGAINTKDLDYYGDANPHYTFSINLGASYKGFDFSTLIRGVLQQYLVRANMMSGPFVTSYTNQNATFLNNTWTTDNTNSRYPVMSRNGNRNNWNYNWTNDINVVNTSYARCGNMTLGYSLPKLLVTKAGINNLRLWVSGDNLFELSNIKDGFDPESKTATSQGNVDVYARTVSFGIDLTF